MFNLLIMCHAIQNCSHNKFFKLHNNVCEETLSISAINIDDVLSSTMAEEFEDMDNSSEMFSQMKILEATRI